MGAIVGSNGPIDSMGMSLARFSLTIGACHPIPLVGEREKERERERIGEEERLFFYSMLFLLSRVRNHRERIRRLRRQFESVRRANWLPVCQQQPHFAVIHSF